MENIIKHTSNYLSFDKKIWVGLNIFKCLVLLLTSAYIGTRFSIQNSNLYDWIPSIILIVFYLLLEAIFLVKQISFSDSLAEELQSKYKLTELSKKNERQHKIFSFLDTSIKYLNTNTCNFSEDEDIEISLKNNLKSILAHFIYQTNYFLDIDKLNFSIGAIINKNLSVSEELSLRDKYILDFSDDFNIIQYIKEKTNFSKEEEDFSYNIKSYLQESINLNKYICKNINLKDKDYTVIVSPIPTICDNGKTLGCIYAIYEGIEKCNCDSNKILEIQCRIITNWLNQCWIQYCFSS